MAESACFVCSFTSVAHYANGGRGEENYPLLQQSQTPQDKDVSTKELEKLSEAASWVSDLEEGGRGGVG